MEENSELEEGEACCYKDDDDNNMDPDIAFSCIDERIQSVLGHFQKDFEGRVSVENLGAKFGGYGSFIPAYERSSSTLSHPKTPQGPSTPKSPNNLALEGALQSSKTTSNIPLSVRPGTAAYNDNSLQRSVLVPGDTSVKRVSDLLSSHCALKSNLEGGNSHKSGNPLDRRTLKVRLKVGSDKILQKSAAIYSGLGLDNSPSSSLGNSSEVSGEMLPVSQHTANESPTSILQVMTSLPFPGGILLSPLHESLLCLIRKKTKSRDKTVSTLKVEESINIQGSKSLSKEAKVLRKSGRPVELKHESSTSFENDIIEQNIGNDTIEDKDILSSNLKHLPLSNVCFITGPSKAADRVSDVASEDGVRDRFFSCYIMVKPVHLTIGTSSFVLKAVF